MAKIAFSKLKAKVNEAVETIEVTPEVCIEVKQYLPIQEKLALIGRIIMSAHDEDFNFSNPVKCAAFRDLEVVMAYTNLSFTDKQLANIPKLYDMLASSGILVKVISAIPEEEYDMIVNGVADTLKGVYDYQHSVLGIMDNLKTNYSEMSFDVNKLVDELKDAENFDLVKGLLTQLN